MIAIRRAEERGHARHGWLDSHHTFSFAGYFDPDHMGFSDLRVINEDRVAPGAGFPTHPHRDMEIISVVLDGALEHRDSMGNGSVIRPGEVQVMSAGRGVTHSEFNHSASEPVHFLQIWIVPAQRGTEPRWDQKVFEPAVRRARWQQLVGPDDADGSLVIGQDARLFGTLLETDESLTVDVGPGRSAWIHVVRGGVDLDGRALHGGDAAAVSETTRLQLTATSDDTEVLYFDLRRAQQGGAR